MKTTFETTDVTLNKVLTMYVQGVTIIDSHDGKDITEDVPNVAVLKSGEVCPLMFGCRYQSLNPIRPNNGRLVLSQMSVGGVIEGSPTFSDIEAYNASVKGGRAIVSIVTHSGEIFNVSEGGDDEEC